MKKKRVYLLSAILGLLIVLTLVTTLTDNKKATGNFSSELLSIDPAEITTIRIAPGNGQEHFSLEKSGDNWMIRTATNEYNAFTGAVENLLSTLNDLNVTQIVTQKRDTWAEYSVDDTTGTKLELFSGEKPAGSLVIGRITFAQSGNPYQQQPDAYTFVRKGNEKEVYKTKSMLGMTLSVGISNFRSGQITKFEKPDLQNIAFTYPADSSVVLTKTNDYWEIGGTRADSASMDSYLNNIRNFTSREFSEEMHPERNPEFRLELSGASMVPVTVKGWTDEKDGYYITSSLNMGTVFLIKQEQFNRLFKGKTYFTTNN